MGIKKEFEMGREMLDEMYSIACDHMMWMNIWKFIAGEQDLDTCTHNVSESICLLVNWRLEKENENANRN